MAPPLTRGCAEDCTARVTYLHHPCLISHRHMHVPCNDGLLQFLDLVYCSQLTHLECTILYDVMHTSQTASRPSRSPSQCIAESVATSTGVGGPFSVSAGLQSMQAPLPPDSIIPAVSSISPTSTPYSLHGGCRLTSELQGNVVLLNTADHPDLHSETYPSVFNPIGRRRRGFFQRAKRRLERA